MVDKYNRPAHVGPQTDYVECHFCGCIVEPHQAGSMDISPDEEYYPDMVAVCPRCDE